MAKHNSVPFQDDEMFRLARILSAAVAMLMTTLSGLGLLFPDVFYPTSTLQEQYLANDAVSLLVGLPLFGTSCLFKEQLLGVLLLPGALVYVIYNYIAYFLERPTDWITVFGLVLVILSCVALISLLKAVKHEAVKQRLEGWVGETVSGCILVVFGLLFITLAVSTVVTDDSKENPRGKVAVAISDIGLSLGLVGGGILILGRKPLGYSIGLGLLVAASCLFLGLLAYFLIAPLISNRPFDWTEVLTVLPMGFICFVPTGVFWRGVVKSAAESEQKAA